MCSYNAIIKSYDYRDVAEQLSITTDGVKKHVMKALSTLRQHFHKENAIDEVPERSDSK